MALKFKTNICLPASGLKFKIAFTAVVISNFMTSRCLLADSASVRIPKVMLLACFFRVRSGTSNAYNLKNARAV